MAKSVRIYDDHGTLGKDEVASSNLASSSKVTPKFRLRSFLLCTQNRRPHSMQADRSNMRAQGAVKSWISWRRRVIQFWLAEYEVSAEEAAQDVAEFMTMLRKMEII